MNVAYAPAAEIPWGGMVELSVYVRDSEGMSRADFERAYPDSVLLVDKSEFDSAIGSVSFETVAVTVRDEDDPQGYVVFPVTKNRNNPWPERISLGRARNCDLVLRHASVSKLHAHFFLERSKLYFADAKSTNGCKVNDRPLDPGERIRLSCGDLLCLGMIESTLYSPAGLFRFIEEVRDSNSL
ncbi:MAG: FHA domain-containing protein [Nannocystales bacterium]